DPAELLVALAHRTPVDLIVAGSHGRTGLERLMLGSVATKLLPRRTAPRAGNSRPQRSPCRSSMHSPRAWRMPARVVRAEEEPAIRRTLPCMTEVVVVTGHEDLERDVHLPRFVGRDEGERSLEIILIRLDGNVGVRHRHAEAGGGDDVLAVRRDERRGMTAGGVRNLENLGGLESRQINSGHARRVVPVDEEPAPIGYAVRLGELGVV